MMDRFSIKGPNLILNRVYMPASQEQAEKRFRSVLLSRGDSVLKFFQFCQCPPRSIRKLAQNIGKLCFLSGEV